MSSRRRRDTDDLEQMAMVLAGGDGPATRGATYRDANRTIARLVADGRLDAELEAVTIQQIRQLAAAIDRSSGLAGRKQESYALTPMHKQLAELVDRIMGRQSEAAGLSELLDALAAADPVPASG
jgi:hypothetical protein